jgi:hypothetical protein
VVDFLKDVRAALVNAKNSATPPEIKEYAAAMIAVEFEGLCCGSCFQIQPSWVKIIIEIG